MSTPETDDHAQTGLAPFGHTRIDLPSGGVDLLDPPADECSDFRKWIGLLPGSYQVCKRLQLMKRFAPIAAIAVGSLLLISCESRLDRNRHLCGLQGAGEITPEQLSSKLGMKGGSAGVRYCRSIQGFG